MSSFVIMWLVAFLVCLVLTAVVPQIISLWFGAGSLLALLAAGIGLDISIQFSIFLAATVVSIVLTQKFSVKFNKTISKTNYTAVIGLIGTVTKEIAENESGVIVVEGREWSAKTTAGSSIKEGERVVINDIKGVHAIVSPYVAANEK